jgi:hypothetical protein
MLTGARVKFDPALAENNRGEKLVKVVGHEGIIWNVPRHPNFAVKERFLTIENFGSSRLRLSDIYKVDPLAERKRRYIHNIINTAFAERGYLLKVNGEDLRIKFIHIEQATTLPQTSISVMRNVSGYRGEDHEEISAIYQEIRQYGVEADFLGSNLKWCEESGCLVVLEALGEMHPEILKMVKTLSQERKKIVDFF